MQRTSAPNIGEAPLPQRARSYWRTRFSALLEGLETLLEAERAQLPPWFVVGFGSGIAAWFSLDSSGEWQAFLCLAAAASLFGFAVGEGRAGRALGWLALAAMLGCALVWGRSAWVQQPRLDRPMVTEITGTVVAVDHLAARETVRLLEQAVEVQEVLLLVKPVDLKFPPWIRVSIDEDKFPVGIAPDARIHLRARLAPPPPMALPGTYDFARDAWFKGIGAVGKSMGPVTVVQPALTHGLDRVRQRLAALIGTGEGD